MQELCLSLAFIPLLETTYQPEKIPQRDMMEPPKFTQPLTDRTTTRGYSTHLFCSVRGFPQVSGSSVGTITSVCGQPPPAPCLQVLGHGWMRLGGCSCPQSHTRARLG